MKTKYFILSAFFILILGFQSCEVTDRIPENAITDLNYWKKIDDLRLWARYFYTVFPDPQYRDNTSDIIVQRSAPGAIFNTNTVPTGDTGWGSGDWANIRRCNYFMTHYQTVEGDPTDINHYVGEVRFFRAYEYFSKVKTFGDVPWFDKDLKTNDTELLYKGRDPRLFVIGKVVEDLEFAANNMKRPSEVSKGQLHRYCAWHFLSRVCLYEATWQKYRGAPESVWKPLMEKAASAAKNVMESKLYAIEPLATKYIMDTDHPLIYKGKFIQIDLTNDKEAILARHYLKDVLSHGLSRRTSNSLSKDFIEQFLDIDGTPIALSKKYLGDESVYSELQNRDPRMWNIVNNRHVPFTLSNGVPVANIRDIPAIQSDAENVTGYISTKFRDPDPEQWVAEGCYTDWYLFRYSETLLNYVEAMCELGQCTQQVIDATINLLRARLDYTDGSGNQYTMGRLSVNPVADPMAVTITGQLRYGYEVAPILYEIRRERCIELALEGFRWDDICRWKAGKLFENPKTMWGMVVNDEVIALYTQLGGTNPFTNSRYATINDWDGKTKLLLRAYTDDLEARRKWNDRNYLEPLPLNQITLNPKILPQNPGWE